MKMTKQRLREIIKEEIQKEYGKTIRAKISNIVKKQA